MSKKYHVFISSTLDDLKAERRELVRIVSELGAVPVTMDAFDITLNDDLKLVQKAIEESDYFLNLTAYKIGEAVGKSFALDFEYSFAVKNGVPVLALIIGDKARWKATKKEKSAPAKKALETLKAKLEGHAHETWINIADLRQKATALLTREMNLNPRRGWVPSDMAVEPVVANELARLIRENEMLKNRIRMDEPEFTQKMKDLIKRDLKVLAVNHITLSFYYVDGENWENTQSFRYLRLFKLLAPELYEPKTAGELSHFLGNILNPDLAKTVRKDYPTPSNTVKKIMSDFSLLKLVKCVVIDGTESWELTEYGTETFAVFRLRQMNRLLIKAHEEAEEKKQSQDEV